MKIVNKKVKYKEAKTMNEYEFDPYKESKELDKKKFDKYYKYQKEYTDDSFWDKLKHNASKVSNAAIEKALTLYFAMKDKDTPLWAKTVIAGALGYFIFPLDAVPDILPALGYTDDTATLIAAIVTLGMNIKDKHVEQAKEKINSWYEKVTKSEED